MALGSKKRDYVTEHRAVTAALAWHDQRMDALVQSGQSHGEASRKAFYDWMALPSKDKKIFIKTFFKPKHTKVAAGERDQQGEVYE